MAQLRDYFRTAAAAEVVAEAPVAGKAEEELIAASDDELDSRAARLLAGLLRTHLKGFTRTPEEDETILATRWPEPTGDEEEDQRAGEDFDVAKAMILGGEGAKLSVELAMREKRAIAAYAAEAEASAEAGNGLCFEPRPRTCH